MQAPHNRDAAVDTDPPHTSRTDGIPQALTASKVPSSGNSTGKSTWSRDILQDIQVTLVLSTPTSYLPSVTFDLATSRSSQLKQCLHRSRPLLRGSFSQHVALEGEFRPWPIWQSENLTCLPVEGNALRLLQNTSCTSCLALFVPAASV